MKKITERLKNGILKENPIFVQTLGMCPTLAVTTSAKNGLGMGLATTAVLIGSNMMVSLLRNVIPAKIRIPAFIVIIASFVTLTEFILKGFVPSLYKSLGLFIPLIVVNCIILGRAEAYASKNSVGYALLDGLGMGLGFTVALTILATVREFLGSGTIFGMSALPSSYKPAIVMILAPGAFFTLGFILAGINYLKIKKNSSAEIKKQGHSCGDCNMCHGGGQTQ